MKIDEKLRMYNNCKTSADFLQKAGVAVKMMLNMKDKVYLGWNNFLQNIKREPVKALPAPTQKIIDAHQEFVKQYEVARDGREEQRAITAVETRNQEIEKSVEEIEENSKETV